VFIKFNDFLVGFYIRFDIDEATGKLKNRFQAAAMHYPKFPSIGGKSPHNEYVKDLEQGSESKLRQAFVKTMKEMGFAGYLAYRIVNRINVTSSGTIQLNPDTNKDKDPSTNLLGVVNAAYQWRQENIGDL
jgi:hypothetical protein